MSFGTIFSMGTEEHYLSLVKVNKYSSTVLKNNAGSNRSLDNSFNRLYINFRFLKMSKVLGFVVRVIQSTMLTISSLSCFIFYTYTKLGRCFLCIIWFYFISKVVISKTCIRNCCKVLFVCLFFVLLCFFVFCFGGG